MIGIRTVVSGSPGNRDESHAPTVITACRTRRVRAPGGDKISAAELEGHLAAHPKIRQAAVVPYPHPVLGEAICACIVPRGEPPRLPELKKALQALGVADFKLPDMIEEFGAFPLTGLGKVDKKALVSDLRQRHQSGK